MSTKPGRTLTELVKLAFMLSGTDLSDLQLAGMVEELSIHPLADVEVALKRCRSIKGRITLDAVLDRLPSAHPGAEEAWAIVAPSMGDEGITVVWTDEMREAFGVARHIAKDRVAARLAFKERYQALVEAARARREKPNWIVSLGHDEAGREGPIMEAVSQGRVTQETALRCLPVVADQNVVARLLDLSKTALVKTMPTAPKKK